MMSEVEYRNRILNVDPEKGEIRISTPEGESPDEHDIAIAKQLYEMLKKDKKEKELIDSQSLSPPKSVVGLKSSVKSDKYTFNSPKEAVDALYRMEAEGDKYASNLLKNLWRKYGGQVARYEGKLTSISSCLSCGEPITRKDLDNNNGKCPYCGYDLGEYLRLGGEMF